MARAPRTARRAPNQIPTAENTSATAIAKPTTGVVGGIVPGAVAKDKGVDTKHPDYEDREEEWKLMRDTARGETAMKEAGETYLPKPVAFTFQKDKGVKMYDAYLNRAQFPDIVYPTIMGMAGVITRVEMKIEMPDAMEPLWERATKDGMTLEALARRIVTEVLETGRYVLLTEAAPASEGGSEIPYIAPYACEALINWSAERDFFVLDESGRIRMGFDWMEEKKWRVLELNENKQYEQRVFRGTNQTEDEPIEPRARANKPLDEIPIVIINTTNLGVDPVNPPLIGVARSAKAIYQLSADYRHQLFMTGQETLFIFNAEEPDYIGAGVIVAMSAQSKDQHPPSAEYVGPSGEGIDAHSKAIQEERNNAAASGARLFNSETGASEESGEAKKTRYAAETATLLSISQTCAQGLERALRYNAIMMGLNPEDVIVTPNIDFLQSKLTPEQINALLKAWTDGAISYETLYENLQRGEIASAERTFDEEQDLIDEETENEHDTMLALGVNPITKRDMTQPDPLDPNVPPAKKPPVKKPTATRKPPVQA